jgi:hypothetical protein
MSPLLAAAHRPEAGKSKAGTPARGVPAVLVASGRSLGERGLANRNQQVMTDFCSECVVLFLKPD